jgi:hypothetical protein
MRAEYAATMKDVLLAAGKHSLTCFTLDDATNAQRKQVINMMACGPKPFFLEHLTMELRTENAANLQRVVAELQPAPTRIDLPAGSWFRAIEGRRND